MIELTKKIVDEFIAKEFVSNYTYAIYDDFTKEIPDADIVISTKTNMKKAKYGNTSGNIKISVKGMEKPLSCTLYRSEKKFGDIIVFTNDISHDLITAASGKTAVDQSFEHVVRYLENSVKSMLGINTPKEYVKKEEAENSEN